MHGIVSVVLIAVLLASCSGGAGTMDNIMQSWQGAPIDAAIAQWGYPQKEDVIAGHKIYRWYYDKGALGSGLIKATIPGLRRDTQKRDSCVRACRIALRCV